MEPRGNPWHIIITRSDFDEGGWDFFDIINVKRSISNFYLQLESQSDHQLLFCGDSTDTEVRVVTEVF